MGEAALKSHMASTKHKKLMEEIKPQKKDFGKGPNIHMVGTRAEPEAQEGPREIINALVPTKNDSLTAEVMWALKVCNSHYSNKSCEDTNLLFRRMFPDSQIAANFKCGEIKSAYLVKYGVAPYFRRLLSDKLKSESCDYVLLFDESMNIKLQSKQMDFHIRLWDDCEISTRFFDSAFMGHATADDMVNVFNKSTSTLQMRNLLQLSMDGPNVNWKFFEAIQSQLFFCMTY